MDGLRFVLGKATRETSWKSTAAPRASSLKWWQMIETRDSVHVCELCHSSIELRCFTYSTMLLYKTLPYPSLPSLSAYKIDSKVGNGPSGRTPFARR